MIFTAPHDIVDVDLEEELYASFALDKFNGYDFFFNIAARKLYEAIGSPKNHIVAVYPKNYPRQCRKMRQSAGYKHYIYPVKQCITFYGNATRTRNKVNPNIGVYGSCYLPPEDVTPEKIEQSIRAKGQQREGNLDDYSFTLYETVADKDTQGFIKAKLRSRDKALRDKPTPTGYFDFNERGLRWW